MVFGPNLLHRVLNVAFCQKTLKRYRALKKGSWCLSVSVTYVPLDWWGVLGAATLHYTNGLMGGKTDKKNQTEFCHILVVSNANWRGNNICANMMDLSHDPRQPVAQWGHSYFEVTFQFLCFYNYIFCWSLSWELISVWGKAYFCLLKSCCDGNLDLLT